MKVLNEATGVAVDAKKSGPLLGPMWRPIDGELVPHAWLVDPVARRMKLVRLDTMEVREKERAAKATKIALRIARQMMLPGTERECRYIDAVTLAAARKARKAGK